MSLAASSPRKKLAVLFPGHYTVAGGMGRTAALFCNAVLRSDPSYEVVLGCNVDVRGITALIDPDLQQRFSVSDLHWAKSQTDSGQTWVRPYSLSQYDFMDCDLWILFNIPSDGTLCPLKPYMVFTADLLVRVVPNSFLTKRPQQDLNFSDEWIGYRNLLLTIGNADLTFVTTPRTHEDVIGYAGTPRQHTDRAPYFATTVADLSAIGKNPVPYDHYILWTTNDSQHKNHIRALQVLEQYFKTYPDEAFPVVIVGTNTGFFNPNGPSTTHPYHLEIHQMIQASPELQNKLHFVGSLDRPSFEAVMRGADFLWHNVLYDNGTACCVEAAELGVPSLAADYPQMRFFDTLFATDVDFFPPYDVDASVQKLIEMTRKNRKASFSPTLHSVPAEEFQSWIRSAVAKLLDYSKHETPSTAPSKPEAEQIAEQAKSLWFGMPDYLHQFPWEDVPVIGLHIAEEQAATVLNTLALFSKLIREQYQNFKLLFTLPPNPSLFSAVQTLVLGGALQFDLIYCGSSDETKAQTLLATMADRHLTLRDTELTLKDGGFQGASVPAITLQELAESSPLKTSHPFVSDLLDTLSALQQEVASRDIQHPRGKRFTPTSVPQIPAPPTDLDFTAESGDALVVKGFYLWENTFRWVAPEATLKLFINKSRISIRGEANHRLLADKNPPAMLSVYIKDTLVGSTPMQAGPHTYTLPIPSALQTSAMEQVRIVCNKSVRASEQDDRIVSWQAFQISIHAPDVRDLLNLIPLLIPLLVFSRRAYLSARFRAGRVLRKLGLRR